MSHPATPTECPTCGQHLVVSEPVWEDGQPTGREQDVCRSCGPLDTSAGDDGGQQPARKTQPTAKK